MAYEPKKSYKHQRIVNLSPIKVPLFTWAYMWNRF